MTRGFCIKGVHGQLKAEFVFIFFSSSLGFHASKSNLESIILMRVYADFVQFRLLRLSVWWNSDGQKSKPKDLELREHGWRVKSDSVRGEFCEKKKADGNWKFFACCHFPTVTKRSKGDGCIRRGYWNSACDRQSCVRSTSILHITVFFVVTLHGI